MESRTELPRIVARLVAAFESRCTDVSTLKELTSMSGDTGLWSGAHDLFQRIRQKTLRAERKRNQLATAQYCFEEVCAKTFYNLSGCPAPFDADSPDWILPNALALASALAVPEATVRAAYSGLEREP